VVVEEPGTCKMQCRLTGKSLRYLRCCHILLLAMLCNYLLFDVTITRKQCVAMRGFGVRLVCWGQSDKLRKSDRTYREFKMDVISGSQKLISFSC